VPLQVRGLSKAFGGELALDGVDLDIADGEIHALLGPNGSGKSTLIGCLSGRLTPDQGTIDLGAGPRRRFTPRSAFAAGAAVIYQHFSLISSLSVVDNVYLGSERTALGHRLDRSGESRATSTALAELGAEVQTSAPVSALSVGQKQLVEIAKAMRHEPKLLVLDEPTAALGEAEARALGQQLRRLRDSGLAILYVTHLLSEVFDIADRVTVLRDGRTVLSSPTADLGREQVIRAIAPRGGAIARERQAEQKRAGASRLLSLDSFTAPGVGPVDLDVDSGEVLAIFGLLGSGRSELLEGLYGIRGRTGGEVSLAGKPFRPRSAGRSLRQGLGLVPADRGSQSVLAEMSALDNMLLPHFGKVGWRLWRSRRRERAAFEATAGVLRLKPSLPASPARNYSGGNQQKLVVGRWLTEASRVRMLLLDEPTQGIDVGARADLYELVRRFAAEAGRAVLFTSSDPEEVEALADRVLVLVRGGIVAELRGEDITSERMLDLAHGNQDTHHN
jgi:ribose transport system ATP-binding protein